jgi:hypothetical protein
MICYLLESPGGKAPWYLALRKGSLGRGQPYWTASPQEAIRFTRQLDAELFLLLVIYFVGNNECKPSPHEFDDPAV